MKALSVTLFLAMVMAIYGRTSNRPCKSIYIAPHASIKFNPPINRNISMKLYVEADGKKESCDFKVTEMSPQTEHGDVVRSPTTQTDMKCKFVGVKYVTGEGYISSLSTSGTPTRLKLKFVEGKKVLANKTFNLKYKPTELIGEGCQKTNYASAEIKLETM